MDDADRAELEAIIKEQAIAVIMRRSSALSAEEIRGAWDRLLLLLRNGGTIERRKGD